jgi:hypothetical protein
VIEGEVAASVWMLRKAVSGWVPVKATKSLLGEKNAIVDG